MGINNNNNNNPTATTNSESRRLPQQYYSFNNVNIRSRGVEKRFNLCFLDWYQQQKGSSCPPPNAAQNQQQQVSSRQDSATMVSLPSPAKKGKPTALSISSSK